MSELIEVQGEAIEVKDTETFASGFTKRVLVVKRGDGTYPDYFAIDFKKDKVDLLDGVAVGSTVKVGCYLGGRLYEHPQKGDMYFTELTGWTVESDGDAAAVQTVVDSVGGAVKAAGDDGLEGMPF